MAKTPDNDSGKPGKAKTAGKPAQGGKAPAKRANGKPARGKPPQKPQQRSRAAKPAEKKGLTRFLRDVRIELGKVTWPTRKDLIQSTIVVLVAVAIATVYTGALDFVFAKAVDLVLKVIG